MSIEIIKNRLAQYNCETQIAEEHAIKEITQEIILMSLSRQGFFVKAEFHGGTALRILYGLPRFSEDLDFALHTPNKDFSLLQYMPQIVGELRAFGYEFEIQDRSKANNAVQKAFLKDNSIGKILLLHSANFNKKIKIKLEIDSNPPLGADLGLKYLTFPFPFSIEAKTLSSSFSGKIHALLCRNYIKGRDWYDFIWYISRNTEINFLLLKNALIQQGPWQSQQLTIDVAWLQAALEQKIRQIDWNQAALDVMHFVPIIEQQSFAIWSANFFLSELNKLIAYL